MERIRAVGYHVPSSDYDFLGLCKHDIYMRIAELSGIQTSAGHIDVLSNEESSEFGDGATVDMLLFDKDRIEHAFQDYNDVVIWIWMNSRIVLDRENNVLKLKQSFSGYPREVLEQKLRYHWLRDYDLSIHGITYHVETQNIFSIVYALASKMSEFCKLCCLLEGKPFPYPKWLFRACQDTEIGKGISPIFERVLGIITRLDNDLRKNWSMVEEAVQLMDTDACNMMEDALVEWGFGKNWVHDAHHDLSDALFDRLL